MKLFKSFVLAGLMAVVAYGVYATIIKGPKPQTTATAPAPLWDNDPPPGPVAVTPGELMEPPQVVIPAEGGSPPPMAAVPPSHGETELPAPPAAGANGFASLPPGADTAPLAPGEAGATHDEASAHASDHTHSHQQPHGYAPAPTGPAMVTPSGQSPAPGEGAQAASGPGGSAANVELQAAFDAALLEANQLIVQNRLAEAHLQLSRWYGSRDQLDTQRQQILLDLLDRLAAKVVYSRESYLDRPHVVQPDETLEAIAERYGVPARLLEKINRLPDAASLRPGTELKVVRGPFHAEVQLERYEMTLFLNDGRYAGRFTIGLGSEVPAKEGEYVVTEKAYDPPYIYLDGRSIPGGDPNNPLGNRLVELGVQAGQEGELAIHGTNSPQSVGSAAQEGCIRLRPQDADDVYDILSKNASKVIIRR